MNFFEAQREARRDSTYLLFLFLSVCAVTSVGTGLAISVIVGTKVPEILQPDIWHSPLFLPITLGTLALVGMASLFRYIGLGDGRALAERMGGMPVSIHTANHHERRLINVAEEMAIASGCPVPRVYVLPNDFSINAFAAGKDIRTASIGVTRGALETLDRDELQGVVAHEFSHIIFADTLLNQRIAGAVFGLFLLTRIGEALLRSRPHYSSSRRNKGNAAPLFGLALLLIGAIGLFFGRMLQAAISRKREYLADAASAQFTRNPESLARALAKTEHRVENYVRPGGIEFSHLFFASMSNMLFLDSVFATHPPVESRVNALLPNLRGSQLKSWIRERGAKIIPDRQEISAKPAPHVAVGKTEKGFGMLIAATAGMLSEHGLEAAKNNLSALQHTIHEVFEKEGGPEAALGAIMRISSEITDPNSALDRKFLEIVNAKPESFITLLQLIVFGLKEVSGEKREELTSEVRQQVLADQHLRPRELLLASFCRMYLSPRKLPSASAAETESAALHWISFLSGLTPEGKWARTTANTELARVALRSMQIHRTVDDSSGIQTLLDDLAILSGSSFKYKKNLISAMWACLTPNGKKTTAEVELIRGFSILLQVPIPMVV